MTFGMHPDELEALEAAAAEQPEPAAPAPEEKPARPRPGRLGVAPEPYSEDYAALVKRVFGSGDGRRWLAALAREALAPATRDSGFCREAVNLTLPAEAHFGFRAGISAVHFHIKTILDQED